MIPRPLILAFFTVFLFPFSQTGIAADKSGVSPNTISLPKGPGSIEGLGESFQPTLNTGTAKYGIRLTIPPGTAGHAPALALQYEGGNGNGPLGYGWRLPLAFVQRQTDKGIPTYGEAVGFTRADQFINDAKEELVPQANGDFFCKNEGAFIRYRQVSSHWEGTLPDGTRMEFGLTEAAQIRDSANTNQVFCWLLERETDTRGNTILYSYSSFPGQQNSNQKYLSGVRYGTGAPPWTNFHFVTFLYENRPDWFEDCRAGFLVRTGKRLKSVVIGTQGPPLAGHAQGDFNGDTMQDNLVRRYDLNYLEYAGTNSHWSLLAGVTLVSADGTNGLPPSTFGYVVCNPPDTLSAAGNMIGAINAPPFVMDRDFVDFVDLNGDGLPDVLQTGGPEHLAYLNRGETNLLGGRAIRWESAGTVTAGTGDAWTFTLTADSTHLADMDGDGLADLVHKAGPTDVFYFANQSLVGWSERHSMSTGVDPPPAPFGTPNVRTADVDFDKRVDLIRGDGLEYQVWFSLGGNRYSERITVSQVGGFDFTFGSVQIVDFNGDRIPDIARIWPGMVEVTAGLGYARFAPLVTVNISDGPLDGAELARVRLTDINSDGLADLVVDRATDGNLHYWLNLGNYSFSHRKTVTDLPTVLGTTPAIRWADINGNGTTDLIFADANSVPNLQALDLGELMGCAPSPNALLAISNGIGRVTLIGYDPSTKFALEDAAAGQAWPDPMPFPVSVVSSVTNLDSLGHQYVSQFRYHDGYYDPVEKQFRGFARVEQVDLGDASAPTLVTRSHFDTGRDFEVMKGKLLRLTAEQENGLAFNDDFTSWTIPPVTLHTGTNGVGVSFAHPIGRTNLIKELGEGTERRLEAEMDFDDFGNQILQVDYGIVEGANRSVFNDERITTTEFAINTNAWILRLPKRAEIKDETGSVLYRAEFFYDDETFAGNNLGIVTIGNLTMRREWTNAANPAAFIVSSRTRYDSYGNPTTILGPLANAAAISQGHAREIAYDARFHAYPTVETIHIGNGSTPLVFQAAYDEGFGTVTSSTDFNTNTTAYTYDAFARLTSIVKPGDTSAYPTVEYDYALAIPFAGTGLVNYIETRQLDRGTNAAGSKRDHYFISRQFVDGLGRKLLTKTEAEPAPGSSAPRVVVSEAVQFNARQQSARILNPFFSLLGGSLDDLLSFENIEASGWHGQFHNQGNLVNLDLASAHKSLTDYDATLRPIQVTNPDGTQRRTAYEPLRTRSFDENDNDTNSVFFGTPMGHHNDGLGRLIRVDEVVKLTDEGLSGPLTNWTTRYEYDLNDQLTRITDSQNNVKNFAYDGLKRKIGMNDPDRGVMQFVYDDASNLIETTDARGQRITYTYDGANRIRTEKYHDGQPAPPWRFSTLNPQLSTNNSVIYHYDTPFPNLSQGDNTSATARNVKGALAWVEDLSGEEHASYDARGRVEWVVKRIPDPLTLSHNTNHASLVSYRTGSEYDSLDRLTRLTYPDADYLRYEYNDRNLLERIPGDPTGSIISNLVYQPSAQNGQIHYGNGVRTRYAYDSRLRLKELSTLNTQLSTELVHFGYEFDGVSNIKSIADLRPGSAVSEGDPRRNTQVFQYDDLYRLTRVQYSFELPGQVRRNDGFINYRYDRIGNMLTQTSSLTNHVENGLPVANLGEMDSGGVAGRWDRVGRAATNAPGPHALTAIRNPQVPTRNYLYDANGNMTNIDGLICVWDFKDRLVAAENTEMRSAYTYDYTDRRITKNVAYKPSPTNREPRITTAYINKYFEVREHDVPTKYVWNGHTRIARVNGSLNTNFRVQRLRVFPGRNLLSLAVNATNALQQLSDSQPSTLELQFAFKWNPPTQDWLPVAAGDTLPAGTVLWLKSNTNATLTVTGTYTDPSNRAVIADGDFLPSAGLEEWNLKSAMSNLPTASAWTYDGASDNWLARLPPPLQPRSDLPAFIAPGEAVFVRADAPAQLEVPESALRIRYFHQDHHGSSSGITDLLGDLCAGMAFYPFGSTRNENSRHAAQENYQFLQKERDVESGLDYIEARFLVSRLARFTCVDPAALQGFGGQPTRPQSFNPYAYAENRPLVLRDVTGLYSASDLILDINDGLTSYDQHAARAHQIVDDVRDHYLGERGWHKTSATLGMAQRMGMPENSLEAALALLPNKLDKFADTTKLAKTAGKSVKEFARETARARTKDLSKVVNPRTGLPLFSKESFRGLSKRITKETGSLGKRVENQIKVGFKVGEPLFDEYLIDPVANWIKGEINQPRTDSGDSKQDGKPVPAPVPAPSPTPVHDN